MGEPGTSSVVFARLGDSALTANSPFLRLLPEAGLPEAGLEVQRGDCITAVGEVLCWPQIHLSFIPIPGSTCQPNVVGAAPTLTPTSVPMRSEVKSDMVPRELGEKRRLKSHENCVALMFPREPPLKSLILAGGYAKDNRSHESSQMDRSHGRKRICSLFPREG